MYELRFGKFPLAVDDLSTRAVKAHHAVPARDDRKAIRRVSVAAAELNGHRTVWVLFRGDVVERIGFAIILVKVPVRAVNADRPEAIDGSW
jgi:hypothetical protein